MSAPSLLRSPSLHTEPSGTAPPDAFGSFRVLHQIGAGTLGPVFRGYDAQRERLVAIKVFKLDLPPERVHQLVAELERLVRAQLTHPAIAAPVATGITGVSAFLATDYVGADSLDLAVREHGATPPARALTIAATLADALDAAAAAAIVHGAMHPRDVLLSDDEVRVTGLGVTQALRQVGVTAPVRRPYTAPERIAGTDWDRRADVFSLAALVYELLWGKRVTGTGDQAAGGVSDIKGANQTALKRAFARALDENPSNRFETAGEFAESLKAACPGVRIPAAARRRPVRREIEPRLPLDTIDASAQRPNDFDPDMLDLRLAEGQRYTDVAPPLADAEDRVDLDSDARATLDHDSPIGPPAGFITQGPDPLTVLDRSRSAVWPLALALMLGIALGFAAGFGFSGREPSGATSEKAPEPPAAVPGREFTEGTVREASKPAVPAITPAPAPKREIAKAPAVPRPDLVGHLLIRSTPPGARVFVDDRDVGRTPAAVRDVAVGAHRVRVTHDGYATEERSVTISRRKPTQGLTIALKRPAAGRAAKTATVVPRTAAGVAGALVVESRPPGAKVFLDGKLVGTTPMSMPTVPAGEHAIRLEHDGYRQWSSTVRVGSTGQNRVTASLER